MPRFNKKHVSRPSCPRVEICRGKCHFGHSLVNGCTRQNTHSDHGVSGRQSIGESINSPCAVIHVGVIDSGSRPNTGRHQDTHTHTHTHTHTRSTAACVCEHTCALHTLTGDNLFVVHQHRLAPSAHHANPSEHAWCVCVCV